MNSRMPFGAQRSASYVAEAPTIEAAPDVTAVAFYLPQFHPIPVNDANWGEGFTEWRNVARGQCEFTGHHQPRIPANYGYYDLRLPEIQERQTRDAKAAGIGALCYYYYWFDGQTPLLTPLLNHRDNQKIDLPFCLCFANENWTKRWDGLDDQIIYKQTYGSEFAARFWQDVASFLASEKYLRDQDGNPVLLIYRPSIIPQFKQIAETWRALAKADGFPGLTLIGGLGFEHGSSRTRGLDSFYEFPPLNSFAGESLGGLSSKAVVHGQLPYSKTRVHDYRQLIMMERLPQFSPPDIHPAVMPSWDNVARRPFDGNAFSEVSPSIFEEWTRRAAVRAAKTPNKLLFVNAWNEWAEGTYLEPDQRYGWAFLSALTKGISKAAAPEKIKAEKPIAIFVHVHYEDIWGEIATALGDRVKTPFHLVVTSSRQNEFLPPQTDYLREFKTVRVENKGRDILPFLLALSQVPFEFDVGLKLHTKRSPQRTDGNTWRRLIVDDLVPSGGIEEYLSLFREDPNVGIIAPDDHWVLIRDFVGSNLQLMQSAMAACCNDFSERDLGSGRFVAGSMFWFRRQALASLDASRLKPLFELEGGQLDGTTAHALERLFSLLGERQGYFTVPVGNVRSLLNDLSKSSYPIADRLSRFSDQLPQIESRSRIELVPSHQDEASGLLGTAKQQVRNKMAFLPKFLRPVPCHGALLTARRRRETVWKLVGDDPAIHFEGLGKGLVSGTYRLSIYLPSGAASLVRPSLYVDSGAGYNEAEKYELHPVGDYHLKANLLLNRGAISLRFDPSEGPGSMSIGRIRIQRSSARLIAGVRAMRRIRHKIRSPRDAVGLIRSAAVAYQRGGRSALKASLSSHDAGAARAGAEQDYSSWVAQFDTLSSFDIEKIKALGHNLSFKPKISIIVPTYNTPKTFLGEMLDSVVSQTYENWELCIADDASTEPHVAKMLQEYALRDKRIKVTFRAENGHISNATNSALELATGDWIAFLDHDDLLRPHSLFHVVEAINSNSSAMLIYSDEDKLDEQGRRCDPYFKSQWNLDLFLSHNMICHFAAYRAERMALLAGMRAGYEGAQDYDLALRFIEGVGPHQVIHIPRVLYHWRRTPSSTSSGPAAKPYAHQAGVRAINDYLQRNKILAEASLEAHGNRVRYSLPSELPFVSIIMPTRDKLEVLGRCVASILQKTDYRNFELIIVDNGSIEAETKRWLEEAQADARVRVIRDDGLFSFSRINNAAAKEAKGSVLVFVNNDLEVITREWLSELVSICVQDGVGAVGAKLYFPSETIQHAGVITGIGGVAGHSHKGFPRTHLGYKHRLMLIQRLSAVTAACLAIKAADFWHVNGFDDDLAVAFNDVDLCLKLDGNGLRNIYTPYAELYHHESATRGYEDTPEKLERFRREFNQMKRKWGARLTNDPYYSPNLTLEKEDFSFAFPPRLKDYLVDFDENSAAGDKRCVKSFLSNTFEPEINVSLYKETYGDLAHLSDEDAFIHFDRQGRPEGRISSKAGSRESFLTLIQGAQSILEIGPFCAPVVSGNKVRYFDVLSSEKLVKRAKEIGYPIRNVPEIHFVSEKGDLGIVDERFDAVISSHCIEHQPDLVAHLQSVARILVSSGFYYLIIPNKLYCFDHCLAESTIAQVIQAHEEKRKVHTLSSLIEHRALTTHNDVVRHWQGDHVDNGYSESIAQRTKLAVEEYVRANGSYIDVHAWQFTPRSFRKVIKDLYDLGLTSLKPIRVYETPWGRNEFTAILQKV